MSQNSVTAPHWEQLHMDANFKYISKKEKTEKQTTKQKTKRTNVYTGYTRFGNDFL